MVLWRSKESHRLWMGTAIHCPGVTPYPYIATLQMVVARRMLWEEDTAAGAERHITPITNVVFM